MTIPKLGVVGWRLGKAGILSPLAVFGKRGVGGGILATIVMLLLSAAPAFAAPAPSGPDVLPPKLELRYQKLTSELRCPVCQNETIAVSDSVVSADLRRVVREKLRAGASDREIRDYMIARYGLFAVYDPPVAAGTWALWFGPLALLLLAALIAAIAIRRRRRILAGRERAEFGP
ncbi:MAG TPA: cytochrome c-type biogenesis protein [Gammaproteobacteria bacterium]|nr:cytochrome c-type biogenesis protein [Gammaproteobacteria bacterium]